MPTYRQIQAASAWVQGLNNEISHGDGINRFNYGAMILANGKFNTDGDAQIETMVARMTTSDATPTRMTLTGQPYGFVPPNFRIRFFETYNQLYAFEITVIGFQTGGVAGTPADTMVKKFRGAVKYTGSTPSFIGSVIEEDVAIDSGASLWIVAINLDPQGLTFDAMSIEVTGETDKDIQWVAKVELVETAYL